MSRRFNRKGKKAEKAPPRKFDPSPLIGDVDLSNQNVKLLLVRMPASLSKQFEDGSRGVVGRMKLNTKIDELKKKADAANNEVREPGVNEENPFVARPLDMSVKKVNQQVEGTIFIDKPLKSSPQGQVGRPGTSRRIASVLNSSTFNSTKYELLLQPSNADIAIFSGNATKEEDEMKIEGIVEATFHARPPMTESFRKLNKFRTYQLNKAPSKMSVMTESEVKGADQVALRPDSVTETVREREERRRAKEESRRHLDIKDEDWQEQTRSNIFKAYEIQAYYTAEELAVTVDEPVGRLRPFISELCRYIKAGPYSQRYELKDEFKTVSQRQTKERTLEEHRQAQQEIMRKRKEERDREREREKGENSKKKARLN